MEGSLGFLKFSPIFRSVRWGGTRLAEYKNVSLPTDHVGESWEISGLPGQETVVSEGPHAGKSVTALLEKHGTRILGERFFAKYGTFFPVLIKFIDAEDDLSIQVHPKGDESFDDSDGKSAILGKTELWYIISSESGSYIYSGFNRPLTRQKLESAMASNTLVNVLAKHFSGPGDMYYIPAGRIHSIGAGNLLLEIQQTSGVTYRLHDYNRKDVDGRHRQLHVDKAMDVIDYSQADFGLARPQMLIDCETWFKRTPYFTITAVQVMDRVRLDIAPTESPRILIAITGSGSLTDSAGNKTTIRQGETILVPAETEWVDVEGRMTPLKLVTVMME